MVCFFYYIFVSFFPLSVLKLISPPFPPCGGQLPPEAIFVPNQPSLTEIWHDSFLILYRNRLSLSEILI